LFSLTLFLQTDVRAGREVYFFFSAFVIPAFDSIIRPFPTASSFLGPSIPTPPLYLPLLYGPQTSSLAPSVLGIRFPDDLSVVGCPV